MPLPPLSGLLPLRVIPVVVLLVFVGLLALLGLLFTGGRKDYAQSLVTYGLAAACALAAGKPLPMPKKLR